MMRIFDEITRLARVRYVFVVFLVLLALAEGAAHLATPADKWALPSLDHYRVIFTIWVTIVLMTPALCFFIFAPSGAPNTYWRAFWTVAYLALLAHLYWAIFGVCGRDLHGIFDGTVVMSRPECLVAHPKPDLFLAAWWGFDVILAWLILGNVKWVQVQRRAVHLLAFVMFFGAFVLAAKAGMVAHLLGILMALLVLGCFVLRLIRQEGDIIGLFASHLLRGSFEAQRAQELRRALSKAEAAAEQQPQKPRPVWDLSRVQLELYINRNLSQVRNIFWITIVVMGAGFCLVVYGVIRSFDTKFEVAALVSISGLVTQTIGATFLLIYRSIMQQARDYVTTLERINAVGMAVAIVDLIPDESGDAKTKARADLVKQMLVSLTPRNGSAPPN